MGRANDQRARFVCFVRLAAGFFAAFFTTFRAFGAVRFRGERFFALGSGSKGGVPDSAPNATLMMSNKGPPGFLAGFGCFISEQ
jgi:hypothetical protein